MIYYTLNGRMLGPVTIPELHGLYLSGRIEDTTPVKRSGSQRWSSYRVEFRASAPERPLHSPVAVASGSRHRVPCRMWHPLVLAGWIMLGATVALGFVPLFGFGTWLLAGVVAFTTIVLGIIALAKGAPVPQGVALLGVTLFVFPVVILVAPLISTAAVSAAAFTAAEESRPLADARPRQSNPFATLPTPATFPVINLPPVPVAAARPVVAPPSTPARLSSDKVEMPDSTWSVVGAYASASPGGEPMPALQSISRKYITVTFRVTNTSREDAPVSETPHLIDASGRHYAQLPATGFYLPKGAESIALKTIPAGSCRTGTAIYEVPGSAHSFAFEARALGLLPDRATIRIGL